MTSLTLILSCQHLLYTSFEVHNNNHKKEETNKQTKKIQIAKQSRKEKTKKFQKRKVGHRAYTKMVPNQKIPVSKKLVTKHTLQWFQTI